MELSGVPGDLTEKFYAIAKTCDEFVIWLPQTAILPTTFGELLLLRADQSFHGRPLWIFAEIQVLDDPSETFSAQTNEGKIGYLLDLPKYFEVNQFSYETQDELEDLLRAYAKGDLALQ